jgi:iron complex transport system permease protein
MKKHTPLRIGKVSFLIHKKTFLVSALLLLLTIVLFFVSAGLGDMKIDPLEVIHTLLGKGTEDNTLVIHTLRLPRIIVALLVGASLAVAGAILQGIIRNPLASPDIVGITGGASLAAVAFITYLSGTVSIRWLPLAAIVGAGLVSVIIYTMAWKRGVSPIRLVLIGIGMASAMSALTTMMLLLSPIYSVSQAYIWLTGSVYGSNWENVLTLLPWTLIFLPLAFVLARNINVQELGDEIATSVGSAVQRQRFILLFISVALAGSAVAIGGGIGFVGLIAPHMARRLVGPSFGGLIPVTAMIGGLIVLMADTVARTAFLPLDIPAGVFTSGIGAPFFIYLLYRSRNHR